MAKRRPCAAKRAPENAGVSRLVRVRVKGRGRGRGRGMGRVRDRGRFTCWRRAAR